MLRVTEFLTPAIFRTVVWRAGMLLIVVLWFASAAHAATYEVWSCAGPDGKPAPADGWDSPGPGLHTGAVDECGTGGGLHAWLDGRFTQPLDTQQYWSFRAPKDTTIAAGRVWRTVRVGPDTGGAVTAYALQFATAVDGAGQQVEFCNVELDTPCSVLGAAPPLGDQNIAGAADLMDTLALRADLLCGGTGAAGCQATGTPEMAVMRIYRAAIVLQDTHLPAFVNPPSGSLTTPVALSGTHSIAFEGTDAGSGLQRVTLEVDGRPAVTQELGCAPPYTARVPCKLEASGTLALDTATLADGPHAVRVLLTDATGANTSASTPFTITTANTPTSCAALESPRFAVAFDRRRHTIPYGGRLIARGSLGGVPAGTTVLVAGQVKRAGAHARFLRTRLKTDAAGRFSYRVPSGPSRTLRFAAIVPGQLAYACSKPLTVNVKARVTLAASQRSVRPGTRVRFRGRLRGGYVPRAGKLVELQAHERGHWRSIRTVRSNARGVFGYTYRFSSRARGVRFPIRAVVRPDAGYPWALGTSRRIAVRVR
jgi:hypothetical protein